MTFLFGAYAVEYAVAVKVPLAVVNVTVQGTSAVEFMLIALESAPPLIIPFNSPLVEEVLLSDGLDAPQVKLSTDVAVSHLK